MHFYIFIEWKTKKCGMQDSKVTPSSLGKWFQDAQSWQKHTPKDFILLLQQKVVLQSI